MKSAALVLAVLALAACADAAPTVLEPTATEARLRPKQLFARTVSLGTSISMGVDGAGVNDDAQRAAWTPQLAALVGSEYRLPLIADPGCPPPLIAPLALNGLLLAAFSAFGSGDDLLETVSGICMPLQPGVVLPTNNLAISGARAYDALHTTPEVAAAASERRGRMYSRVLPPGETQVSAMLALEPTFVTVELATNEVLPAATGRLAAMHPYDAWVRDFDEVIAAVQSTGARALLVGLPDDAANFPSVRTAREFFNEWPSLLTLGISVSLDCYFSSNHLFIPGYLLSLLERVPVTATCADVPDAVDYVLPAAAIQTINSRLASMNAHIAKRAQENGYAFFEISVLYDLPKSRFDVYDLLFSEQPFGPNISTDGIHPSAAGQALLADAAYEAVRTQYLSGRR